MTPRPAWRLSRSPPIRRAGDRPDGVSGPSRARLHRQPRPRADRARGSRVRQRQRARPGSRGHGDQAERRSLRCASPGGLVASDERIARYRHPLPTARRIDSRVMLVLVTERWGLHVALTRIRDYDQPSPSVRMRMGSAAAALQLMAEATQAGGTTSLRGLFNAPLLSTFSMQCEIVPLRLSAARRRGVGSHRAPSR